MILEGQFFTRVPYLGKNYTYQKVRIQTFLESIDIKLGNIIESRYICPTKISLDGKVVPKPICVDGMINKKKKIQL